MKCHACGAEAPARATICSECGARLRRPRLSWHRCERCGQVLAGSQSVCPACGQPLSRRPVWPWLAVGLAVVALIGGLLLGHGTYDQTLDRYLSALPTALYEVSQAGRATVTLAPLGPTITPTATARPSATPTPTQPLQPAPPGTPQPAETATPAALGVGGD